MKRGLLAKSGMLGILTTPHRDQLILNQLFYFTICAGSEQKKKSSFHRTFLVGSAAQYVQKD